MNVTIHKRNDSAPLTAPLRDTPGLTWRVYSGDYLDPMFGTWFDPANPPRLLLRGRLRRAPFVSWNVPLPFGWRWRGYVGFKAYGLDSPAYLHWAPGAHVHDGSTALCLSLRPISLRPPAPLP